MTQEMTELQPFHIFDFFKNFAWQTKIAITQSIFKNALSEVGGIVPGQDRCLGRHFAMWPFAWVAIFLGDICGPKSRKRVSE